MRVSSIGLVLGAGGVTGDAFHRGVLRALTESGWDARTADVIVGTSAGAMVGSSLRKPERAPSRAVHADESVHGERLGRAPDLSPLLAALRRPWRARPGVLMSALLPTGRHSTEFIASGVRMHHGDEWPSEALWVVACRRRDGRRVVFGRDGSPETDLPRAVAASCAIPGFFHPVEIDGEAYVDGGVHSPTNADVLRNQAFDAVIVSSPMSVDPRGLRPTLDVGMRLALHRQLQRELRVVRRRTPRVLAFEPGGELLPVMGMNPLHGARVDEIESAACRRAHELLQAAPDIVETLTSPSPGRRSA